MNKSETISINFNQFKHISTFLKEKYKPRRGSWLEQDILRLVVMYPLLYRDYGQNKVYNELSKRLRKDRSVIKWKVNKLNKKFPNLISRNLNLSILGNPKKKRKKWS